MANATREGFLSGLNAILVIGAVLAFAGAVAALWLVREDQIEREQPALAAAGEAQLERSRRDTRCLRGRQGEVRGIVAGVRCGSPGPLAGQGPRASGLLVPIGHLM